MLKVPSHNAPILHLELLPKEFYEWVGKEFDAFFEAVVNENFVENRPYFSYIRSHHNLVAWLKLLFIDDPVRT